MSDTGAGAKRGDDGDGNRKGSGNGNGNGNGNGKGIPAAGDKGIGGVVIPALTHSFQ
ncbi:hypothetical protein E4U55_001488 [Claviceps digitariae]|nr:hypothetical protein E4U55_001488 [Claviceps digitariae]